ncbi:Arginine decarboxylase [Vitis vinifera]|uniref:Arginine decarboxylase n=1 Tax=Vitis vinifera TaxID=29760 RepID=A0A438HE87_VITVI|nr:Arginine decarboxylase [Vitis vinifera]
MLAALPLTNILIDPHSSRRICIGSTFGGHHTSPLIPPTTFLFVHTLSLIVRLLDDKFNVEDVMKFGSAFHFGLEAGSKSKLLLAMSCLCKGNPEALLVYNGFKRCQLHCVCSGYEEACFEYCDHSRAGRRARSSVHYNARHNLQCIIDGCKQVVLLPSL